MYAISNELMNAQRSALREVDAYITVNDNKTYNCDNIVDFTIDDSILSGDNFTIGTVISKTLKLNILLSDGAIVSDDKIKVYAKVKTTNGYEEVPLGVFYVTNCSYKNKRLEVSAMDKLAFIDDEYISELSYPNTLENVLKECCSKCGITKIATAPSLSVSAKIGGRSYRDIISICASLNGGSAKLNRLGELTFTSPTVVIDTITPNEYYDFTKGESYIASGLACYFGDVPIIKGNNTNSLIPYKNPLVDENNINIAYEKLNGLTYTTAPEFKYKCYFNLDAGDFVLITDTEGNNHKVLITTHAISFDGGYSAKIKSVGEGKTTNELTQVKYKNKKSLTELNIKLGQIEAKVEEIDIENIYDSIKVGARNFIQKSDKYIQCIADEEEYTESTSDFIVDIKELNKMLGDYISISVDVELDKAIKQIAGLRNRIGLSLQLEYTSKRYDWIEVWEYIDSTPKTTNKRIKESFKLPLEEISSIEVVLAVQDLGGGTAKVGKPQLEFGRIATSYNQAIEDINGKVDSVAQTITTEYQSLINQTKDSIISTVSETYTTKTDTEELSSKLSSEITQTKEDITFSFTQETNAIRDDLQEYKDEVKTYIRYDADGMEMGKTDSNFKTKLTNTELAFLEGNDKVAYINNRALKITNAEILDTLKIGSYSFVPRSNGNTSWKWI